MNKKDLDIRPLKDSLTSSLPEALKNPANYEEIRKKILESVMTTCSHSDVQEFAACPKCTKKMLERRKLLKKLGFKNPAQYRAWQKIHEDIKARFPLVDWKTLNTQRLIEEMKNK